MDLLELSSSLRAAVAAIHKSLRKQSSAVKAYSMTEIETIAHLFNHSSLLPTELASLTNIKTQSMSQILARFETKGLIKRTRSSTDKRKVYISLSASGKKMVESTKYERDEWLKGVIEKSLSAREKQLLSRAIPVLNKLVENK